MSESSPATHTGKPGAHANEQSAEIASEQAYVDGLFERLDNEVQAANELSLIHI